jgi:hypothetical protein
LTELTSIYFVRLLVLSFNLLKLNLKIFNIIGTYFAFFEGGEPYLAHQICQNKKDSSGDTTVIHSPARLGIDPLNLRSVVGGQRVDDRLT